MCVCASLSLSQERRRGVEEQRRSSGFLTYDDGTVLSICVVGECTWLLLALATRLASVAHSLAFRHNEHCTRGALLSPLYLE